MEKLNPKSPEEREEEKHWSAGLNSADETKLSEGGDTIVESDLFYPWVRLCEGTT